MALVVPASTAFGASACHSLLSLAMHVGFTSGLRPSVFPAGTVPTAELA